MTPRSRPVFGFARRVLALFAVVTTALTLLTVVVTRNVASMHASLERLAEEQRETDSAMYLLHHIRMLDSHARKLPPERWVQESVELDELRFHSEQATATLTELRGRPPGIDPSSAGHATHESRMYDSLGQGLGRLRSELGAGAERSSTLERVAELRRAAEVLNDEVHAEEALATAELERDADIVRGAVFGAALVALIVLLIVVWLVHRSIVQPLLELRASAGRIAAGELGHRASVRSADEVGELAQDFNRMADVLARTNAELEQRVEERTREFLRAARLAGLGTLSAGIAHEINNPLASIASCAEGLERRLRAGTVDPAEQREYLEIIAKEAYRAHAITSRLLEFARVDTGPMVEFKPSELLRDIEVLVSHRLRERNLELAVDCPAELPPVSGRPSECKQVLLNLIHNAIDASPDGGRISVRCSQHGDGTRLEVEDQGPGLSAEVTEHAFDPFFTTKAPGKGTGLGLAIVERIVTSHGGRIETLNTGHGALFRVSLPANNGARS